MYTHWRADLKVTSLILFKAVKKAKAGGKVTLPLLLRRTVHYIFPMCYLVTDYFVVHHNSTIHRMIKIIHIVGKINEIKRHREGFDLHLAILGSCVSIKPVNCTNRLALV